MKTLIKNIKEIVTVSKNSKIKKGNEMSKLNSLKDAWILIEKDKIYDFGSKKDLFKIKQQTINRTIDAENGMVLPCWCDSHTHIVFAGSREKEFVDRIHGLSYEEIAKNGGGILNSAKKIKKITEEELFTQSLKRVHEVIKTGTGCLEIKSGYGLDTKEELKMLRVIQKIKKHVKIPIKSTFLGAHAIPKKFHSDPEKYVDKIITEMIPKVAEENLADYIDIFCEKGYFTIEDTKRLLEAGKKYGLQAKTHVNQFNSIGGVKTSVELGALSVDHLEEMEDHEFEVLKNSNCIPTILPSCSFFLG